MTLDPEQETAFFGKAVALQTLNRLDEAAQLYHQVLARNPNSEEALTNLITIGLAKRDDDLNAGCGRTATRAASIFASGSGRFGDGGLQWGGLRRGRALLPEVGGGGRLSTTSAGLIWRWPIRSWGRVSRRQALTPESVRIRPDSEQAQVQLGLLRQQSGDLKSARDCYESALGKNQNLPEVQYNLAALLERQGQADQAEQMYGQLLDKRPDWREVWFRLGYLRLERADHARGGGGVRTVPATAPGLV